MMRIWFSVYLILLSSVYRQVSAEEFVIGYIDHPRTESYYNKLIERAYKKIGIHPKFVEVGAERGMLLLNDGIIDADTIRFGTSKERFPNIISVPNAMLDGKIALICLPLTSCNQTVLENRKLNILSTITVQDNFLRNLSDIRVEAHIFYFDSQTQIEELLLKKRFDYAIIPADDMSLEHYALKGFKSSTLAVLPAHHLVNIKHQHLIDDLSDALKAVLKEDALQISRNTATKKER